MEKGLLHFQMLTVKKNNYNVGLDKNGKVILSIYKECSKLYSDGEFYQVDGNTNMLIGPADLDTIMKNEKSGKAHTDALHYKMQVRIDVKDGRVTPVIETLKIGAASHGIELNHNALGLNNKRLEEPNLTGPKSLDR